MYIGIISCSLHIDAHAYTEALHIWLNLFLPGVLSGTGVAVGLLPYHHLYHNFAACWSHAPTPTEEI